MIKSITVSQLRPSESPSGFIQDIYLTLDVSDLNIDYVHDHPAYYDIINDTWIEFTEDEAKNLLIYIPNVISVEPS